MPQNMLMTGCHIILDWLQDVFTEIVNNSTLKQGVVVSK